MLCVNDFVNDTSARKVREKKFWEKDETKSILFVKLWMLNTK